MERKKHFEENFKKRYNRDVEVYSEKEVKDGKIIKSRAKIVYNKKEFILEEYFTDEQLTKHVFAEVNGKTYKYPRYLEAEVFIADSIGE